MGLRKVHPGANAARQFQYSGGYSNTAALRSSMFSGTEYPLAAHGSASASGPQGIQTEVQCAPFLTKLMLDKSSKKYHFILIYGDKMMRITVEIDANDLSSVQRATGIRKHSPAIRRAVVDYVKDLEKKRFLQRVMDGKTDYAMNNEDLEARDIHDTH
jgi:Arc/MetJ family transcription regulator